MCFDDYLNLATKKLRGHSYSKSEIKQYLLQEGACPDVAENVIVRLSELSYLDDLILAQDIYRACRRGKPCGRLLWSEKLKQRGIPAEIIAELLEESSREEEIEMAQQLADKYLKTKANKSYIQQYRGLTGYLSRRGFSAEIVERVIREMYDNC